MNYSGRRRRMVERQIRSRGISDPAILDAFIRVPRHLFIPSALRAQSYEDHPVAIGDGQTISQPYMTALMTDCLELSGTERVLEIGTGSGYQTAILSRLARTVYSIERIEALSERAAKILKRIKAENVRLKVSDGTLGWQEAAPFDRILVTAAGPRVPEPLFMQLTDAGKLTLPLGDRGLQELTIIDKTKDGLRTRSVGQCIFVPLVGRYGFPS
ncbi:MAG: protein-L-isoaspartate(D-aspartate) O-methyltransferase [Candidatus Omnitrophica bacterium]|nr:protein-L-isoaspartate(D-aspartate) O-methyltransferase [Candidatus Omnitrophota bacterium]